MPARNAAQMPAMSDKPNKPARNTTRSNWSVTSPAQCRLAAATYLQNERRLTGVTVARDLPAIQPPQPLVAEVDRSGKHGSDPTV